MFVYSAGTKAVLAVISPQGGNAGLIHLEARTAAKEIGDLFYAGSETGFGGTPAGANFAAPQVHALGIPLPGLPHPFQAPEVAQKLRHGLLPDSWNQIQFTAQPARVAPRTMERHREPVRFIAHRCTRCSTGENLSSTIGSSSCP